MSKFDLENVLDVPPENKKKEELKRPRKFCCIVLNDGYTHFETVIAIMEKYIPYVQ